MDIAEEINEEFGNFCINVTKEILEKCVSLCSEHHISAEDLVLGWVAYSSDNGRPKLSDALLEKMVRTKLSGKGRSRREPAETSTIKIYSKDTIDQMSPRTPLVSGSSPVSTQGSKRQTTPTQVTPKRVPGHAFPDRSALFSPTSYSPSVTAPSERYESRTGRGEVTARWGPELEDWTASEHALDVTPLSELKKPYRYMFERLKDRTDVLTEHILTMGERLQKHWGLEEFSQPHVTAQEPVHVVGCVACDGQGRLNSKSIVLEGGRGGYGEGQQVELDVSQVKDVGLFTGQVVAAQGVNPTGKKFVASTIYTSVPPPRCDPFTLSHEVTLVVASGPFTTATDLLYAPLTDLLSEVSRLRPQLLLLLGPFIDAKVVENELAETYQQLWQRLLGLVRAAVQGSSTRVLLMPAPSDLLAEPVLPTPPFSDAGEPFTMLPNPCLVSAGGLLIAATASDVLMHLSQQDVKLPGPAPSDRLARLSGYLLDQQSFYPLYPADETVGLDFQHWQKHCHIPVLPHVLVLPSDFKGFIKEVTGCLVVNPSRLSRGQGGGTYARLRTPPAEDGVFRDKFSAQVLKI